MKAILDRLQILRTVNPINIKFTRRNILDVLGLSGQVQINVETKL